MNKLQVIKGKYQGNEILKEQYIDEMYNFHDLLFDYAQFIKGTNISRIEIVDDGVIMTFRDSGIKFLCSPGDKRLAALDTINFGIYETDELWMQLQLIRDGDCVFDIGGNYGWYAMHIAKNKPNSIVYSFEPIPMTFKKLQSNINLNNIKNIIPLNFGFSEHNGTFDFYYDPSLSVNASLVNVADRDGVEIVKCNIKRLDDYAKDRIINFIKCDVEGAELLVFKGGEETIKRDKPIIFSEMLRKWTKKFNYHPNNIMDFLADLSYQCFILHERKFESIKIINENTVETNYFFLHSVKHKDVIKKYT